MEPDKIKSIVRSNYSRLAVAGRSCGCGSKKIAHEIGYAVEDINHVPEANMGLGCGNPTAFGRLGAGDTILDLGCGAGFDAFLAAKSVGETGLVIGVDMTEEMITKAQENAKRYGYKNVTFIVGDIEDLPIENNSINTIISNCVINLAPDKSAVFREAHRVLKAGGKMFVSDIVLLGALTEEQRNNEALIAGCVGGAIQKDEYIDVATQAGFTVAILKENIGISKQQYQGMALESITLELTKR